GDGLMSGAARLRFLRHLHLQRGSQPHKLGWPLLPASVAVEALQTHPEAGGKDAGETVMEQEDRVCIVIAQAREPAGNVKRVCGMCFAMEPDVRFLRPYQRRSCRARNARL